MLSSQSLARAIDEDDNDRVVFEDDEKDIDLPKFPIRKVQDPTDLKYPKEDVKVNGDLYIPATSSPPDSSSSENPTKTASEQEASSPIPQIEDTTDIVEDTTEYEEATESPLLNRVLITAPKICPEGKKLDKKNRCHKVYE